MTEQEAIELLVACHSLVATLVRREGCYDYQLSDSELAIIDGYTQVVENFPYRQQFTYLAERAGLSIVGRVCLVNIYSIVCLRRLQGKDASTGRELVFNSAMFNVAIPQTELLGYYSRT